MHKHMDSFLSSFPPPSLSPLSHTFTLNSLSPSLPLSTVLGEPAHQTGEQGSTLSKRLMLRRMELAHQ